MNGITHQNTVLIRSLLLGLIALLLTLFYFASLNFNQNFTLALYKNATIRDKNDSSYSNFDPRKLAYVFYATDADYFCHALVNVHLLINRCNISKEIDIVILVFRNELAQINTTHCLSECFGDQLKLIGFDLPQNLTKDEFYKHCHMKLFTFSLYKQYKRIVFYDSDGLILRNVDHLFRMSFGGHKLAATYAYWYPNKWLTSAFFVAELSSELNETMGKYLNRTNLEKIANWSKDNNDFDMEIVNYEFERQGFIPIPPDYMRLDRYFKDEKNGAKWNETYYVHFTQHKPLKYARIKKTRLPADGKSIAFIRVYELFWSIQVKACTTRNKTTIYCCISD